MMLKETKHWLIVAGLALMVSACGGNHRELQAEIDRVKSRPGSGVEPLPEVRPAPSYVYEAGDRRSPFVPETPNITRNPGNGVGPDLDRPREMLEAEPLDALTMVGTLRNAEGVFGLVVDSQGLIHRPTIGDHMGQNYGRITDITEAEIQLLEIISDGLGGYYERPASIGLSD